MNGTTPKRHNRLLSSFILISLGIHFFIFLHVAGIYNSHAISYIELSMQGISKPDHRVIPKPRVREAPPAVSEVKTLHVKDFKVPKIKIDVARVQKMDYTYNRVLYPRLPDDMNISGFLGAGLRIQDPGTMDATVEYTTAKEYFEMLNLRVHSFKEYPESAKSRHIEGRVKVAFVLLKDGTLLDIKIVKSSRHKNLDEAAIEAIKRAAPFPKPPDFLFTPPITLQINILFELA
ncbi:MAG: energy transducer TonB [Proteobacteria bacterium]|nr:energy transducer TonB [Pseudomonadota bacterium]MBU1583113.1 energy transducer TonB [Pseudomonadota bacterium]MBU2455688.1 energy transducer TonB [Pseudomonadota bacterium]MBU2628687.1 energy transducer TonB [Pseudomonadota bacterium]